MDSRFFRRTTDPNFYENVPQGYDAKRTAYKTVVSARNTLPSPDPRFPGYAAIMEDGRLVTDYRPHCNQNIPAGSQYGVKEWMVKNTTSIIDVSRSRQAQVTGAIYKDDPTVVPDPLGTVKCTKTECGYTVYNESGIGIERNDPAPELFGTFTVMGRIHPPHSKTALTTNYQVGRNTVRGRVFQPLGNGLAYSQQSVYSYN
jgi:hypothetical protein